MKIVVQYYCAECGVLADEYCAVDSCPQCHSNCWIEEEVVCTCLTVGPTVMYRNVLVITDSYCSAHGYL
jgi:hypothetical protein